MFALKNAMTRRGASTIQVATKGFAGGGPKMPPMSSKETDFDIVFVGKYCNNTFHKSKRMEALVKAGVPFVEVCVTLQIDFITNEMFRWNQLNCSSLPHPAAPSCPEDAPQDGHHQ